MPYRRLKYKDFHPDTGILLRSNSFLAATHVFVFQGTFITLVKRARQHDWYFRGHGWELGSPP
ncbi:MAG: hypothetical protein QNJ70_30640 [Xenococcaceae cyanobacterium MO_207.B15]|nr:hypothetical protein [Xenococcaceae cyanobacterium MO_207.B15]